MTPDQLAQAEDFFSGGWTPFDWVLVGFGVIALVVWVGWQRFK